MSTVNCEAPKQDVSLEIAKQKTVHPERSAEGAKSKGTEGLPARLRALRRQAGATEACEVWEGGGASQGREASGKFPRIDLSSPSPRRLHRRGEGRGEGPLSATPSVTGQLRSLLGIRERSLRYGNSQRPRLAPPLGREIACGLQLVESFAPTPDTAPFVLLPGTDEPVERSRLVCFDTETTGLAGGVGTKAFMIGAAQWCDGQLHVRQLYLTTLGGEAAMLRTFASWLTEDSVFVSYNGKSYDAPLLKGRYRIHRLQHPFEARTHVDLLHPVRRAYRGVWGDCRLQTIERNLLGIVREDDLPGACAPTAWLAFLRGVSKTNLARVVEHNQQDVRSLAVLFARLCERS